MNAESKTMFGWDMDFQLDFFYLYRDHILHGEDQDKAANTIEYLIERCKIAEAENKELKDFLETSTKQMNDNLKDIRALIQRAEVAEAQLKKSEDYADMVDRHLDEEKAASETLLEQRDKLQAERDEAKNDARKMGHKFLNHDEWKQRAEVAEAGVKQLQKLLITAREDRDTAEAKVKELEEYNKLIKIDALED